MAQDAPVAALDPAQHAWLRAAELRRLFAAVAPGRLRIVGGAIRNALLGLPAGDVDLAISLPPEEGEALLQKQGIKTVRTGFAHGTITAVVSGKAYEITSLRRDVQADGRHAEVAYTDAWHEDAARRDFTMNALYADADGRLYDYHGGLGDLRAGRVRFIGEPVQRIAEDYLRILRFFRFHAYYGAGAPDAAGLNACTAMAEGMGRLSRERVTQEWLKLLLAPDPGPCLRLMRAGGILEKILPLALRLDRFEPFVQQGAPVDPILRLAALLPEDRLVLPVVRAALRLSGKQQAWLEALLDPDRRITVENLPAMLQHYGRDYCRARLDLQAAGDAASPWPALLAQVQAWQDKKFPLQGQDLLSLGAAPSPALGVLLRALENWWLAGGRVADHAACLAEARRRLAQESTSATTL